MLSKLDITLHGRAVNIVRKCGAALTDVLESKFGCVATIDGVDFEKDQWTAQQKRPHVVPEKRFEFMLPAGVNVSVWKADLTSLRVDAVVNAANEYLGHYGGLAQALSEAGGSQIQKESDDYIRRNGNLKTGDAIVGDAGLLPCRKIIHAVGPQLSKQHSQSDVSRAESLLRRTIWSILNKADEHKLKTVAIPAISSGLFNYPLQQCAETIVKTVKHYYEKSSRQYPKEIMLVNNDEPTVREMERACHLILAHNRPSTYSQAAASNSQAAASKRWADAKTSNITIQMGNVHLTLKRGNIEEQRTDVIVNSTYDQNLSLGAISSALLKKAGYGMQNEIFNAPMTGYIVMTKAHKLKCKEVYHTFCTAKWPEIPQQVLFKSVSQCLEVAASKHYMSVAFPAIGTGGHKMKKQEAAQIMSNAVADFAQKCPHKMEVYFVIYPSDSETFQAFEEQLRYLQKNLSHLSSTHEATEHREELKGSRAPTPQISLSGPSDEATREADRWLHSILHESFRPVVICNNFILHFGKKEHQQLSRLMEKGVSIEECFDQGRASIIIHGRSDEDVVPTWMQVEAILCNIQREFVREEEQAMSQMFNQNISFERRTLEHFSPEFADRKSPFDKHMGLQIVKVDKVENAALNKLFDLKKEQLNCFHSEKLFQCIPVQFCEMVCRIGFQAEYAPPDDPAYGEGIYFTSTVRKAMEVWKEPNKEYLHFVEAEVLTGKSTPGKPGLILPPVVGTDLQSMYDSVRGPEVSVIFSGYQALPKYIITCRIRPV